MALEKVLPQYRFEIDHLVLPVHSSSRPVDDSDDSKRLYYQSGLESYTEKRGQS